MTEPLSRSASPHPLARLAAACHARRVMFTGLIRQVGTITALKRDGGGLTITVASSLVAGLGDSIAIDGCCLTVIEHTAETLAFFVADESLRRTNLGDRVTGEYVHIEPAMLASTRLDGHIVQGHVDAVATLTHKRGDGDALWLTYKVDPLWTRHMVDKGSITIDGVSLTLTEVTAETFSIMVIPHTQTHTHLTQTPIGHRVNIECDVLGKYVAKWLSPYEEKLRGL